MRLFLTLFREYPRRTVLVLFSLSLAAVADGIGMTSLLPALGMLVRGEGGAGEPPSALEQQVAEVLARFGFEPTIDVLVSVIVVALLSKSVLTLLSKRQVGYAVAQVATDLRIALLDALMVTRWSYYTRQPVGAVTAAFSAEADRGSKAYLYATTIISQVLQTVLFASIAIAVSWQATLAAAGVGVIVLVSLSSLVRMTKRAGIKQTRITRRAMSRLTDTLHALKPLKAMSREQLIGPLLQEDTNRLNSALRKLVLGKETLRAIQDPLIQSFILLGGYFAVQVYSMPLAEVMILLLLFQRTLGGLTKAQRQYQSMVSQEPAYWSIRSMIEHAGTEREETLGNEAPTLEREISLRNVHLSYEDAAILSDVSIEIPAGQITGLVGASGGGKTTIGDLIVGLLRPDAGEIYIDDLPLREVDIRQWRENIGYVPQEMFLLNASVAHNVTLGDERISSAQVERALVRAGAADFVAAMPEGVESSVGERGALLSGGQRQRISIARALVHDPKLLLLDEASAALDPATEKALWDALVELKGEVTILAISHQPALFAAADRVYRVEAGSARLMSDAEIPTVLVAG